MHLAEKMAQALDTLMNCTVLAQAVAVLTDPTSNHLQRSVAQHVCDEFRQKSPLYVTYGLQLAESPGSTAVRLFGLQAVEYFVKFRWVQVAWDGRMYLKNRVMKLISDLATPVVEEDPCVKETIIRILIEMIKQDWPEYWGGLLAELNVLCHKGPLQAELVMCTLLQMAEDARTLPHARMSIIQHALHCNVQHILAVVRLLLRDSIVHYKLRKTRTNLVSPIQECCCVIRTTLKTLAGYLDWVEVSHITENNFQVLDMLWCLLADPELQMEVAECLLIAINRIGILPGSKPLLIVFEYVAIPYIFPVLQTTVGEVLTERRYYFLKKLCQMMCMFGEQLCRTLGLNGCVSPPSNFGNYLDNLLDFTTHCSQFLSSLTQNTWRELFSHKLLSSDPRLLAILPRYLLSTRTKLMRVGFPSKNNSPTCEYSRFDFATDEDFCEFLTTYRKEQKLVIEVACQLDQVTCCQMTIDWLKHLMLSSVDSGYSHSPSPDGWCNQETSYFLQWEAMTFLIEIIITNMLRNVTKGSTTVNDGIEMLQLILNFKSKDPLVLSCIPSTVSALLPFLDLKNEYLPQVLTKLLEIIEAIKAPKAQPLSSARRIAFFSINQICRKNAQLCLPSFEMLFSHVKQLLCDELLQLTQKERCLLMESVVILINQFKNYEQQKAYLEELMAPVTSLWLSEEMQRVFANPKAFVSYVGADLPAIDTIGDSPTDLNRSGIIHCVTTILGVLQWTCCPTDLEDAKAGGFFVVVSSGKLVCRNPCTEQVLKLLDNLLVLIRTQHNLFLPEVLSKMCDQFPLTLDLVDVKNTYSLNIGQPLLDIYDLQEYKTAPERMQGFFNALYGCCLSILECATSTLKDDFYATKNLVNELRKSVFQNLENIPDCMLLYIVRFFLKPLVSCTSPEFYRTLVCPVIASSLPPLHLRLSQKWNICKQENMVNKGKTVAIDTESYEVQQKRLLTEEVIEFVIDCCLPTEDEKTCIANVPSGTDIDKESQIQDASNKDGDDFIAVESDICCLSSADVDTTVCTAESDDDCPTTADECSSTAVAVNNILYSVVNRKTNSSSVIAEDFDLVCNFPCDAGSEAKLDDPSSLPREVAYPKVVPIEENSVHILFTENADAPAVPLESDDGEIAAEVPQPDQPSISELGVFSEHPQLTQLGICLMEDEDVRSTLLGIAFSSLVWRDACSRVATRLCLPLLQQVILEPLLAETVTHLFTMALQGLHLHRHDPFVSDAINRLAFQIYVSLRPRYVELKEVMTQIPIINLFDLETFDEWLLKPTNQITHDKLQQYFKDLIKSGIQDSFGFQVNKEYNAQNPLKMLKAQSPKHQPQLPSEPTSCSPSKKRKK